MNGPRKFSDQESALPPLDTELELTFRDPAGELRLAEGCALRRIRPAAEEETRAFLASPLRKTLEKSGDLISSRVAEPGSHPCISSGEFWLEHPRIDPISYPWEWSTAQWRSAAELTLRVASQAIDAGWTKHPLFWPAPHPRRRSILRAPRSSFQCMASLRPIRTHLPAALARGKISELAAPGNIVRARWL